jgi:hypothetical protein
MDWNSEFSEGIAVAMPLHKWNEPMEKFMYGQSSAVNRASYRSFRCFAVTFPQFCLMLLLCSRCYDLWYVEEVIPETQQDKNTD